MNVTRKTRWLACLLLAVALPTGCADDPAPVNRDLALSIFSPDGASGFPVALEDDIWTVQVRIYQNMRERTGLYDGGPGLHFDFRSEVGASLPKLDFGENYQIIVEALDQDGTIIADGATPLFDYLPETSLRTINVFVTPLNSIAYATAIFSNATGRVVAPSEFEGPRIAGLLGDPIESLGGQRAGHTVTELADGRLLVIGGARLTSDPGDPFATFIDAVEVYDPISGYWTLVRDHQAPAVELAAGGTTAAPMRLSVARAFHTATLLDNGRVLVAGGFFDSGGLIDTSGAVEIIDPTKGTIQTLAAGAQDLFDPRAMHTAHLINGDVFVVGGVGRTFDRPSFLSSIEVYTAQEGFFERVADPENSDQDLLLEVGRGLHAGVTLPDGLIVTGGRTDAGVTDTIEFLEYRDGQLRTFLPDGPRHMSTARYGHSAVLMEPDYEIDSERPPVYLAVAGGFTSTHPDGDQAMKLLEGGDLTNSVEFFDTWDLVVVAELSRQLHTARAHFQMIETSITRDLLVFGGLAPTETGVAPTRSVERLYRTREGGFPLSVDELPSGMNLARAYADSTAIETHNVMIVGGWSGGNASTVCEGRPLTAGCTSEVANPGDLFNLGYLY